MRVTVREGEVAWVVGHRMAFGLQSPAHVREGEVRIGGLRHRHRLDAIPFVLVCHCIECIIEPHIRIEWVIAGTDFFFCDGIIERCRHFCLLGEELTEFQGGRHGVLRLSVSSTPHHTLFQSAEAITHIPARDIHRSEVRELHIHRTRCSPSAFAVSFQKTEFVDPHLTRLCLSGDVTHTYHHRLHLTE